MNHSPGFLRLVNLARSGIEEITVDQARTMLSRSPSPVFLDVREDHEWCQGHAAGATHLGRGILERDLERCFPDPNTEIIMYCGGGFRSALACDAAQKLGYRKVYSLLGGYKALVQAGWPMASGD
jgi:rhodanese-related sulfurtransferase